MASTDVLVHINMNGNEIQNVLAQSLGTAPTTNVTAGRFYFNTTDNTLYVYNGTTWLNALAQGTTYTNGNGITISSSQISVKIATDANAGNVILTADSNGLAANAPTASTSAAGLIEIATDTEVTTGTDTSRAVTPKQLATKVTANTAITGATKTKITYDEKGLVTAGADLQASDIPNLSLSKITDVTATAAEVNVLDGVTASTAELNILDGVTVTASDINSVTSKIGLTNISIDSGSTNYLGYDNTNGKISAKVDTTVTNSSSKLVTSGAVATAIANSQVGGMQYKGVWTATGQTNYSSITLPVKAGYMYLVSGSATIGGIEWNTDDYLVINADVAAGGTITDVKKIDNTESSDIVRLNSSQTLTNKTIDADDNTISDLGTSNFKSGVIQTSVRAASSATDTAFATEKAVRTALNTKPTIIYLSNPALTSSAGVCTWTITDISDFMNQVVSVQVYKERYKVEASVMNDIDRNNSIKISFNSTSNISAGTFTAVIIGY